MITGSRRKRKFRLSDDGWRCFLFFIDLNPGFPPLYFSRKCTAPLSLSLSLRKRVLCDDESVPLFKQQPKPEKQTKTGTVNKEI